MFDKRHRTKHNVDTIFSPSFWPQDEHQIMYAIRSLKYGLSKSEGPKKWLSPCRTDVHRVSSTIDFGILEQESQTLEM
jgi:hypothetical protein